MKTSLYKISLATVAMALLAVSPVFSNGNNKGVEGGGGKGETIKKEEPAAETQQEKKIEEPTLESLKSEGGLRQEVPATKASNVKSTSSNVVKPISDLAAERPEENASNSALSFNFVFYVLYKFNLSDI